MSTTKKPAPAPAADTIDLSTLTRVELLKLAKAEHVAVKAAVKAGTDRPSTPALDHLSASDAAQRRHAAPKPRRASERQSKRLTENAARAGAQFAHGNHRAVIEQDGTWTVTREDGKVVTGLRSATAASCAAEAPKLRSATGYWKPLSDTTTTTTTTTTSKPVAKKPAAKAPAKPVADVVATQAAKQASKSPAATKRAAAKTASKSSKASSK